MFTISSRFSPDRPTDRLPSSVRTYWSIWPACGQSMPLLALTCTEYGLTPIRSCFTCAQVSRCTWFVNYVQHGKGRAARRAQVILDQLSSSSFSILAAGQATDAKRSSYVTHVVYSRSDPIPGLVDDLRRLVLGRSYGFKIEWPCALGDWQTSASS